MKTGNWKQKASPVLVSFVFGCIFIIIILLYVMQTGVAIGDNMTSISGYNQN
jgi:hypothetical protein